MCLGPADGTRDAEEGMSSKEEGPAGLLVRPPLTGGGPGNRSPAPELDTRCESLIGLSGVDGRELFAGRGDAGKAADVGMSRLPGCAAELACPFWSASAKALSKRFSSRSTLFDLSLRALHRVFNSPSCLVIAPCEVPRSLRLRSKDVKVYSQGGR